MNNNKITIGRCSTSDMVINDISVSRNHCNLTLENDKIYIDDCSSKFGTLLMIQNNFTFVPWKEINLQLGKYHLNFNLTKNILCSFKCCYNLNIKNISYDSQINSQRQNVYEEIIKDITDISHKKKYDDNVTSSYNNDDKSIVSSTIKMLDFSHRETDKNEIEKSQKNLSSKSELDFENSSKENFILKKQEGNTLLFKTEIEQKNNFELSDIKKNNYIQKNFTFNIIKKNSINKNQ
jgi:pSer/pThr/pTyr-binding forkhead associated (FHA) protein